MRRRAQMNVSGVSSSASLASSAFKVGRRALGRPRGPKALAVLHRGSRSAVGLRVVAQDFRAAVLAHRPCNCAARLGFSRPLSQEMVPKQGRRSPRMPARHNRERSTPLDHCRFRVASRVTARPPDIEAAALQLGAGGLTVLLGRETARPAPGRTSPCCRPRPGRSPARGRPALPRTRATLRQGPAPVLRAHHPDLNAEPAFRLGGRRRGLVRRAQARRGWRRVLLCTS